MTMNTYARTIGVLFLLSIVCGALGELYVPSKLIVSGDAAATARNIAASETLFRFGFAAYLVEAICDIALSLFLYFLLRPVQKELSLLAAFFGLVSTAAFATAELFYFGALNFLSGKPYLSSFSQEQLQALAYLSLRMYTVGGAIFMSLYGIAMLIRAWLIYRSRYLPKFLGVLLAIAGLGFIVKNFTFVLAPDWSSDLLLAPMSLAGLALTLWLLIKGVSGDGSVASHA
ncbi:MAG TPA: DUF4386 domain-containing protein [Thermoanaerobaculia bacterium]|jgi:glucan phosphoethanolaminetransferase (alkaline phosphatase superfamily)